MRQRSGKASSLLTTGQAARLLGVNPASVSRWASRGRIRAVTTPGGHRRIPIEEVEKMWSGPARRKE